MKNSVLFLLLNLLYLQNANCQSNEQKFPYVKPLFNFNPDKPVFALTPEQLQNPSLLLRYYSFSGYREGVEPTRQAFGCTFWFSNDTLSRTRRLYMYNLSLQEMLTHFVDQDERVVLEVKDPSTYRYREEYGPKENWLRKNAKCFEMMMPASAVTGASIMDEILRNTLNVDCTDEMRSVPVLVLYKTSKLEKFKSPWSGKGAENGRGSFLNESFYDFGLSIHKKGKPFIDETGYKGQIYLKLNIDDWGNIDKINQQLKQYDLVIKEEKRNLKMLVIRERDYKGGL